VTSTAVSAAQTAAAKDLSRGLIGAGIAVSAWASGTILAKGVNMDGLAVGAYRFGFFAMCIIIWMQIRGPRLSLRVLKASAWGGIALGLDVALFFSAIKLTSVVNATVIGAMQPIVVGVIAARFFGEKVRGRDALLSLVALTGAVLVVAATAGAEITDIRGDLLAVGAMLTWSAYFIFSKRSKAKMSSTEFTAGTAIWTMAICAVAAFMFGQDMSFPTATNWVWLIAMALGAGLAGHALMNWSLVRIPLWVGSTFTLLVPVFSALLAWIFLGEGLSLTQVAAMLLVIGALAGVVYGQSTAKAAPLTAPEVAQD
jgi:drug/metabolite transporter (DMT)-like permease